jgi:hypothetical protein
MCVGDFNEIFEQPEKEGAALRGESQMDGFRNALDECQLGDLGYNGPRFMWSNRRNDAMFTKERLDRAWGTKNGVLISRKSQSTF